MTKKILIIGAGISGCVLAERFANEKNKQVLIIDKRDHIGGNCFDYTNSIGLRVNKYGPHYFRTNDEEVWNYVQKFSKWRPFEAHCVSHVDGKKVPIPVNLDTINIIFGTNLTTEEEMKKFLSKEMLNLKNPKNSEESALTRVGKTLYEKMFKNYTTKQWDKDPKELDPSVMDRIPVRFNHDSRYFTDKYQMQPVDGYTKIFEQMLSGPNIEVRLNTAWDDVKNSAEQYEMILFTGRIDSYFDEKFGKLEYRSLHFEEINLDQEWFQETVQENYPDINIPYTRIVEYKHKTGQVSQKTTIVKEYPTWEGEPYYPVPSARNRKIYEKYQKQAIRLEKKNIYFVGRLANYKYFNMDQAFKNALDLFKKIEDTAPAEKKLGKSMTKGIIYYTDNRLGEPIFSVVQKLILKSNLPIVSVSLKPINFGQNIVLKGEPGYISIVNQIVAALEASTVDYVFFCEHDVLYHKSHFDFTPPRDDLYYYNTNNWRWDYPTNKVIGYDGLTSLSQLCANKDLVLKHFKARQEKMKEIGLEKFTMKDPHQARLWGYEPGRKKRRNGGLLEEKSDYWSSKYPNIDIRHLGSFTIPKVKLKDFIHRPSGWVETSIDKVDGWNLTGSL